MALPSPLSRPKVRFDVSKEAAVHNFDLFKQAKFNLRDILNTKEETSVTTYGSKLKDVRMLEKLFKHHKRWRDLKSMITNGSQWPIEALDEKSRLADLKGTPARGNHKSAKENENFLSDAPIKEMKNVWELILPLHRALLIPGLVMSPL